MLIIINWWWSYSSCFLLILFEIYIHLVKFLVNYGKTACYIFFPYLSQRKCSAYYTPTPPQISICITGNWSNDAVWFCLSFSETQYGFGEFLKLVLDTFVTQKTIVPGAMWDMETVLLPPRSGRTWSVCY